MLIQYHLNVSFSQFVLKTNIYNDGHIYCYYTVLIANNNK